MRLRGTDWSRFRGFPRWAAAGPGTMVAALALRRVPARAPPAALRPRRRADRQWCPPGADVSRTWPIASVLRICTRVPAGISGRSDREAFAGRNGSWSPRRRSVGSSSTCTISRRSGSPTCRSAPMPSSPPGRPARSRAPASASGFPNGTSSMSAPSIRAKISPGFGRRTNCCPPTSPTTRRWSSSAGPTAAPNGSRKSCANPERAGTSLHSTMCRATCCRRSSAAHRCSPIRHAMKASGSRSWKPCHAAHR